MTRFVVRHQHDPEHCPARDPKMGAKLLEHLEPANASKYGIKLDGEGVIDGKHTLYLILEAEGQSQVEKFMQPFNQAGPVEVLAASPCEMVVERGGC